MFGHKNNRNGEKVFRYSIRKYHFGAASVAIAALLFFANGVARADSLSVSPDTAATEKTLNDEGRSRAKEEPLPNSQELAERNLEEKTTKVVDKSALLQVMDELKDIVVKVKESKLAPLSNQLLQLTDESKRLLSDKDAKSEDIDQHILKIRKLIETLKEQESSASQPERKEESKVPSAEAVDETANQAESSNAKDSLLEDKSTNEAATEVRKEETSRDSSKPTVTASDRSLNKVDKEANSLELPNKDNKLLPIDTKSNLVDEATEDVLDKKKKGYSGFRIAHYAARSIDRSVAGNLDSGTISGDGVKQFENLHYDIDGDRTIWRVAVRPAHKNHAWAGIAVTSDDTIENIRVVERGGAGGSVLEEREISRGRPASTPFSNYKMFIGHYRLIGGAVPDRIVYEVTTRGTHHNLFARFATAIVQNTLENSGLSGKAAITSRNSDFPAVGIHVNAVGAPTVNHNYTRTNDTVRMQTVPSTDNQLSGTGKPGATISVKKNGNTFKKTKVDGSGHWVVSLDAGLNSNLSDTGEQLVPKDKITVTQSVDGKESEATNVDVSLGRSWIDHSPGHPVGEVTSNQRNIKLFVPHDAGMAYLKYRDTNNQEHQVAIRRTTINQQWQSLQSNLATVTSVDNTSNKFYSIINLRLNSDMKVGSQTSVISNMKEGGYGSLEGWKPVNVVEAPLTSGAHIESDLTGKASIPADVRVKAPVGSTVKLYDNNDALIGEAQAGNDGYATVHPRNSLPEGQIRATSTPVGGKESAKSDPVNVTRTQIGHGGAKQVSSEGKARATIGVDKEWVTAYRGDHVEVNVSTYAKYLEKFLPNPNTRGHVKGLEESGGFLVTAQSTPETARTGKTSGTIAMDQPLGPTVLNYYVVSKTTTANYGRHNAGSSTNVSTTINVLEVAKKYDISIDKKITVENPNAVSAPEKEKIIAAIKEKNNRTYTDATYRALLNQATYSVDEKGNVTITYPDKSVDKVASSYTIQKRPVIETSLVDKADTQTPITVSADPGSKVKLYDHSGHELGEGTANGNGRVTINPTRPIPNGNVTAKATDNRDNTTDASAPKQATVPAPQALTIQQPSHGSTSVTITPQGRTDIISAVIQGKKVKIEKEGSGRYKTLENAANVRISPNANGSVTFELPSGTRFETLDRIQATAENKDITVASGIRSSQEANQYVLANKGEKVPVKDINHLTPTDKERVKLAYEKANPGINKSEVTVGSNGDITYNHQGRGSVQKGVAKTSDNVVLDNVAPGKPTIPTNLTDKAGTRTQIEVDTEPGASVVVYDHGGQELGRGVANASGKAVINPTKEIPKGNVTAKATDEAGNISQPSDAKVATFQDFTPKVPSKTPVTKVTSLTPDEVNQVKKKVSDANLGKEVQVSSNGTATVTDPKSRISHQISGDKLVESNDKIRPTVEIPYDNADKQEVYVYSGETNNITIKVKDNSGKISKSYLAFAANDRRGLGTEDNSYLGGRSSNGLYLTATKIHSDTPTSENQPATITVSGNLNNQPFTGEKSITRYVFAEDPSGNTNYEHVGHANDVGAPGRIRFVWKPQTFKYDAQAPGTPLLLDSADATQIENAVKQANPTFSDKIKSVTVDGNNVIVTYKDDSTDRLDASKVFKVRDSKPTSPMATAPKDGTVTVTPTGDADKVIVNYTDEQQNSKVVTVVKAKNGTWSSSDKPAGVTVDPRTGTLLIPAEGVKDRSQVTATATKGDSRPSDPKIVTAQPKDFEPVKPDEKVPVKDKAHLTPEEKKQVEDKVKAKNPGKEVTVGEDGTATLKDPTTGISHQIPGTELVNQDFTPVKPDEKVPVKDKAHLTPEEKKQVEDKVKAKNPGKEVTVGEDGTATLKDPTTGISHQIPGSDLVNQGFTPVKPDEKVPVKDKAHLTPEEKKQVEDKVKAKNPGKEVTVGEDGTATLKDPTTGISHQIPGSDLVNQGFTPVKPDEKVPVKDKAHLTPEEKKQVEDKVKAKNPGKEVTVGEDGTATLKDPTTGISHQIPGTELVNQDFTPVKPDEKVPVKDKAHLTPEEKKQVEDKVKAKNPGKEVTVGEDGTATLKDPTTGISHQIPGSDLVNQGFTPVKPDEKVPVKDKAHLTPEEKKQVEDKVKAKNPGKEVTVGEDGTATVTDPTTGISHQIPGSDLVNQGFTPVKPDDKVPAKDKDHLTPEEKKQVEDKVKAKNPGKEVTVGEDGTATLKDPTTGISHQIPGSDLVNQGFTPVKPDEKVPVKDKAHLTPEEKKQVEDKVKAKNPGKEVTVGEDGTATLKDPTTGISHQIPGSDLVNQGFTPVKPDEKVPVKDKAHLTPEEKKQVEDKVKAKNPGKEVTVGEDGTATLKDPTTGISHQIPGSDLVNQDFTPVKPDEKVPVKDKDHLTPEEKKQVEDKVKAKNPGKEVTVGEDGTATLKDPTTGISHQIPGSDLVNQGFTPVKPDEKVPVKDKAHLTPEEKKQVEDKVKAKNPGKEVTVGEDGTATVTDPTTGISHQIPGSDLVNQGFTPVKPDEKVPVKDKAHLTPEEKKQVEDKVKAKNPGKEVTVGEDGTATVTDPTTGISHQIPGSDLVNQGFTPVKPDEKVPVKDKAHLTPEEKKQVEDKVKAKNPGKEVTVGEDGTATVTDPTTGISHQIPGSDLVNQDFTPVKPDEKVPVKDKAHLTPEEKKQVEDKVKAKNPGKEVTVGEDGTATLKDPTTGISHQIPGSDLVNQDFTPVKPDDKVPAKDKDHLTPEEKKQVEDKVKAKNPGKEVTVGEDGTATVTDPTTGISHQIPGSDLVNQGFTPVKPDDKVPAKDKDHLTPEEKKQVEDKVKAKNPGKEVTVGEDGTATLKDPTTGISHQIPGSDLVNQGFTPVKPDEKVPVKDKAHLTPEEKKQVEDKVKAKNPGKEVTVGEDGTATLKDPTTGISHQIPGSDLVNQGFTPVKPDEKVPVKDKAHLTPEEKKQVEDKVKAKNPGKEVTVGEDGTATLKDPTTGISHQIPGSDLVNQDFTPVKPDEKVPVKDKDHLTPEEKKQVEDKVKAKNPGKEVTVGEDGTATLKDPTTGISHQIPGSDLVNQGFTPVKPDEKVPVKDKAHLTPEEKKQVEDKVKAKNPGKEVTVGEDGTATVTDPTTGISHQIPGSDLVNQDFTPVKPDDKVPAKDKDHLTPEEKKQVEDKVKAKNPGKEVTVGEDGTATVTDPTTGISHQIPGSDLVNQDFTPVKPDEKVPVKDKDHLTPEEKKQVEDKVKAKNPGKEVTVGEDGTATLKDPTTGISHQIPGSDLVNQGFTPVKPDEKVPVKDKAHLTPEEKKQVEDKVKAKNPGKEVTVGEDGTATVTDPTTGISHQIPGSDLVNQGFTPVKPDEKVPVKDKAHLTPEEKKQVEDKVKAKNPGKEVTVGEDGTATVTDPTTGISHQIPGSDLVNQGFTPVKPDEKVPVKDKAHLTPEEKKQVEDKVKAKNPGKEVTVGEDGTATVTDPTTGISHQIPGSDLVNQGFTPVKPDEKVPVKDKAHLTPEEKKQVEDKVKAKNPGKEVTVGEDGTATLKDPTTGISHQIPGSDLVNQGFTPVKPDEKVPVKDKAHLTPEEKKQVEDKVKAKNPGKEVTVGEDGTATLKDPTTGISHQIPGSDLVNQDFTPVKPDEKVPVKDKAHLTPEEKKQVEDKVKAKNPGKEVTVGEDGTATLKDPTTGISHQIPGSDLVNQDFTPVKPDEKVPVKDKAHLTPEEKKQVEDKVKAKNPGKEVTVGEDGTATLKDPTTGISHQIPGSDLVNQGFTPVKPDEKVPVKDKAHLTPEEKKQVEDKVKAKNPGKEVTVGEDGTATVTDPTTGISHQIPGSDLVNQDFTPVKPDDKVPAKDKDHLTPEEKKQVEDKVKAKNPGKEVTVGEDGTATVTDPTTGISHQIPGSDLVNQDFTPVKPDDKVPAKDKDHLTPEEKKQVEDKVKAKNPGKEVTVGEDGTATVTDPTTGISHQIPGSDLVNQDFTPVKPDEKVPVKDKDHLTPEEKKQVEDKVKAKNPGKEVTVGEDGTATVTDPTTGISHQIPGSDLVNQGFTPVKPDEKVPVKDKAHLTPEEKKQVEDKVKAKNPGKEVTVGEDGTATVTDPTTGISHQIPGSDLVNQGFTPVKPDEKVPVKDKAHLTPEEKKQVEDKVKAKNPGKEVTVGEDGTATLKDPTTGISHQIPGSDLVNQGFTPVKPDEKVPVKDKAHLTPEEKKQVEDKVKAKNPGKEVTVGEDGTATLKDPTTGISHQIPGSDLVNQDFTPVKPDEKVPVKDKAHLTPEEKKQVEDKVKAKNPGKEVTVGEDGTATLKDPTTGISHQIPGSDLVNQDFTPVKPDEKVPVKDKAHLTPEEKKQVEDKVKAKNPGKEVTVGEDGTATLKDPTTGISHQIPGSDLVNQDFGVNGIPEVTPSQPAYTDPVGTSSTDGEGNVITPPTVEVPAYTDPVGTSSTDGEGNLITPPSVEVPAYTDPVGTSSTDGEGNVITPPTVEVPAYTDPVGTSSTDGEGNVITPPTVEVPAYTDPVGTSSTDGEGNVITPPTVEVPAYTGSVNGIPEVTPAKPDYEGSVNSIPEEMPVQPDKDGSANEMSEGAPISETTINKDRQLPNTGTEKSNTSLIVALLAAMTGGLLISRKRKEEE